MPRYKTIHDPNQIVEPGTSDKAVFDAGAYHKAMRDGRNEGAVRLLVVFFVCGLFGFFVLHGFAPKLRLFFGLFCGAFAVAALFIQQRRLVMAQAKETLRLHQQAHLLEAEATRLEIEAAKSSGAFDRWKGSR